MRVGAGVAIAGYKAPPAEAGRMTDDVRCWLVAREYDQRNLVTLTYATPDGERAYTKQTSLESLQRRDGATAARDVAPDDLDSVDDDETRERYAAEAERMAADHDPDEEV